MKLLLGVLILVVVSGYGCGISQLSNVRRTITLPDNTEYVLDIRKDDLASFKAPDGTEFSVDGRGRASLLETIITMGITQTEFNLSNQEGR